MTYNMFIRGVFFQSINVPLCVPILRIPSPRPYSDGIIVYEFKLSHSDDNHLIYECNNRQAFELLESTVDEQESKRLSRFDFWKVAGNREGEGDQTGDMEM